MLRHLFSVDIEPTNRCNASCYFCPRDQTPHQGLLAPETFEQALARAVEFRPFAREVLGRDVIVSLCGLGEPLLNKHTPSFVARVNEEGFDSSLASNGALLTESVGERLLDGGLKSIQINVGEQGEAYEEIYKLPWEKTLRNVVRFAEMAEGRCHTQIVLVNHRGDDHHNDEMKAFWLERGINQFVEFDLINRGGALFVDSMQYESYPQQQEARRLLEAGRTEPVVCQVPFVLPFIGFDGQYYLCCSDWRKEAGMGTVFDRSLTDVVADKLAHVTTRDPVCKSCNHDPLNRVTDELRLLGAGTGSQAELDQVLAESWEGDDVVRDIVARTRDLPASDRSNRRLIPVRAEATT